MGEERVSGGVRRGGDGQKRVEGLSQLRENETLHCGGGREGRRVEGGGAGKKKKKIFVKISEATRWMRIGEETAFPPNGRR